MGMDRSKRVDRTHVGGPRKGRSRRQMVQSDRQGMEAGETEERGATSHAQPRRSRGGRAELRSVSPNQSPTTAAAASPTPARPIPAQTRQAGLDTQAGQQGIAAAGSAHGRRPGGANRAAQRAR